MAINHASDLAKTIITRGTRKHRDKLPALNVLREILEIAFYASLETEEGRDLRFGLCCIPKGTLLKSQDSPDAAPRLLRLEAPTTLSIDALRKFAPAVSSHLAYILVEWGTGSSRLSIAGIVHLGPSWDLAKKGYTDTTDGPPNALLIDTSGRGRLEASVGHFHLAQLAGGKITRRSTKPFLPLNDTMDLIRPGLRRLSDFTRTEEGADVLQVYMETLCATLNGIEGKRHGGTVLLCSQRWAEKKAAALLKPKYRLAQGDILRSAITEYLHLRRELLRPHLRGKGTLSFSERATILANNPDATSLRRALNSAALTIAELASVDGAVLLTTDLTCYGFGCEILTAKTKAATALPVSDKNKVGKHPINSEERGMRHRSALRLCGTAACSELAAFVCSQDGGISMIYRDLEKRLLVRKIVAHNYAFSF